MKKLNFLLMLLFISPLALLAQNSTITGVVTSDAGEPLPGVTIIIQELTQGTVTDLEGRYSISAPSDGTLIFSFIGYTPQTVSIEGKSKIDVVLMTDYVGLEEVVAIGYGTVKKSDLTGSVVSLGKDDLNEGVTANINQMISGRASGVQVFQNSSEPGGGVNIQIRGVSSITADNEPLYVIDGLPIDNSSPITGSGAQFGNNLNRRNPLNTLNPNDIASIEVLKDASATAIYGSRGANGVIMITTKKGVSGEMKVSYDAYYGVQSAVKTMDVMTAEEYMTALNQLLDDGAVNATEGERVTGIIDGGTDWQQEVIRTAPVQSHNLSLSGGDGNSSYYASFGYFNQQGIVISSGLERYTARLNFQSQINEKFKFGVNLNTSFVDDDLVLTGTVPNEASGVISAALDFDPTLPVTDEFGKYVQSPFISKDNPVAIARGKDSRQKTFRTFGTVYGEYFIMPELSIKVNVGGDVSASKKDVFIDDRAKQGQDYNGVGTVITGFIYNYVADVTANYSKTFNADHAINLMAGVSTQKFFIERFNANASNFVSLSTGTNSLQSGSQETFDINTSKIPSTLLSYLGRANYNFQDRFLLTATFRADGSSKFGDNNKYGYFPSAALAWKLSNEQFIQDLNTFSNLKFRASWGQTGNQGIGNYNSLTTFSAGGTMIWGDTQYVTMDPTRMANPDLKWETTTQTNLGIDYAVLEGRISGSIDWFNRKTTDLLLSIPVPSQTGFTQRLENVGSVLNKGWEFSLISRNFIGDFKWSTNLNFSVIKNEVLDLGIIDEIITGGVQFTQDVSIIRPGEVMNSYYGHEIIGVWQVGDDFSTSSQNPQPGDWKYKDQLTVDTDGDGVADAADGIINADDKVILGSPVPDFTWGITNDLSYKNLSLSFNIQGVYGADLLNNTRVQSYYPINFRRNKLADAYVNRWTPDNPTNEYASFINPSSQGTNSVNSKTVENASYIKLQNVTLSYKIPTKGKVFDAFSVYVSGTNLITLSGYSGMDPGANVLGTSANAARMDYDPYPMARTFSVGVNVGF
jgi:TonB-dependent starch-binding outer membrane protein SusC